MAKFQALLLTCSLGLPGMLVGFVFAYFDAKEAVASQIAARGWADSTGVNDVYWLYGLAGYVVSVVVGDLILKRVQRRSVK